MENYQSILEKITSLLKSYACIKRGQILLPQYQDFQNYVPWKISIENPCIRESLLTHVGCLPILASFLHPYIEHTQTTDLGKVLSMLAIHDIWETIVWDVISLQRNHSSKEEKDEINAAKQLLPRNQFKLLEEFEKMETNESKFSKALDRLICLLRWYIDKPEIERERRSYYWATLSEMYKKWLPRMERDEFLLWFFNYLVNKMKENVFHK